MSPRLALVGQIGVVVLLAAALWDPTTPWQRAPIHLVLLLDESASVGRAAADGAWQTVARALSARDSADRLSLVRFAHGAAVELAGVSPAEPRLAGPAPPRRLPLSDRQTDIAAAVWVGLGLGHGERSPALILVSDGIPTLGDTSTALKAAAAARAPVLWWRPEPPAAGPDAWIARVSAPPRVGPAEPLWLTAILGADAAVTADLVIGIADRPLVSQPVSLAAGRPTAVPLTVELPAAGSHEVTAELRLTDRVPENNRRTLLVEREGLARVVLVSPHAEHSTVAASLDAAGWPLATTIPAAFSPALLEGAAVLIIEGLTTRELTAADWTAIERAVRVGGTGLIVLGGPGTFAEGGYRHSTLESLLPVVAEAPRPQAPAAIVFAVDTSGSMAQPTAVGATRLALAGRAVGASARSLTPADSAALIAFDRDARTLLPLARRPDQPAALEAALDMPASGGTRIAPALERALSLFEASDPTERLLVITTDGRFTDPEELRRLAPRIATARIDVVAIAVGAAANVAALEPLVAHGRSRLLHAADAIEVPALMQSEVAARRSPVRTGPVTPANLSPLPFGPRDAEWPPLGALQITRARPGAAVYLATDEGEPVLAAAFRGAGRTVALPAGLGVWATEWASWPEWGRFLGGLVQWAAGGGGNLALDLKAADGPEGIRLTIDSLGEGGDWAAGEPMPLAVRDPLGDWRRLEAHPQGPGRWAIDIASGTPGRYDLITGRPGREQRWAVIHDPMQELIPGESGEPSLDTLAAQGLVTRWSLTEPIPAPAAVGGTRRLTVALAVVLLALVLIGERLPRRSLPHRHRLSTRKTDGS